MTPGRALALRYVGFAIVATLANLGAQRLVLSFGAGIFAALVVGTGIGLVVKYLLDKRWIFEDRSAGLAAHGRRFSLYTLMGLVTTAIFWGFEFGFWRLSGGSELMRELGAILGLGIGYALKYTLDRRFVFPSTRKEGLA